MMNTILNWHTPDNIVVTFIVEKKIRLFSLIIIHFYRVVTLNKHFQ